MNQPGRPRYWSANFDYGRGERTRRDFGLQHNLWLMQYQYGLQETGPTTRNLKMAAKVQPGDFLVGRLTRPSRLFAISRVCAPRAQADHWDTIERTVTQKTHVFRDGVVCYSDAPAFYDDFRSQQNTLESDSGTGFIYAQRIDVENWELLRSDRPIPFGFGQSMLGVPYTALVEFKQEYFQKIQATLRRA